MSVHLQIPEESPPQNYQTKIRLQLERSPLAWGVIILITLLFLTPYIFSNSINKVLGAYAVLPTLTIALAVLAMLPVAIAVQLRARRGALVICIFIAIITALYHSSVYGFTWPPGTVVGWLLGTLGLTAYGLLAGHMRGISNQLAQAHATIQKQALTDALTGLPNHRAVIEQLGKELARTQRYERPFSLIFFDGDRFKRVNDTYGHGVGDVVLHELGERVGGVLRGGDTVGRFGGEEFVILLPEANIEQACKIAERVRVAVAAQPVAVGHVKGGINATISIGVATYPTDGETIEILLEKADKAMYWSKRLGRNQVHTASEVEQIANDNIVTDKFSGDDRVDEVLSDNRDHKQMQQTYYQGTVSSLLHMVELRDPALIKHAYAVSDLATALAQHMQVEHPLVVAIGNAALLHDIGKIGTPDAILQKREPLSPNEQAILKQHSEVGAQLVENSPFLQDLIPAIRHHHERWDGKGYPDGQAGRDIPLEARIIAVADAYDAMVTGYPFQEMRTPSDALAELWSCAGTQFDPMVVKATEMFLRSQEEQNETRQMIGALDT